MAFTSTEGDQHNEPATIIVVFLCGIIGGFLELSHAPAEFSVIDDFLSAPTSHFMTEFLIHFGQAVLFGAAGFIGKMGAEALINRWKKKEGKEK